MPDVFTEVESAVRSYSRSWPATFVRASGAKQWAEDGTEYIDFFSGAGALNYGHNDPAVIEPLIAYLQSGAVLHSLDMQTPAKREFLETFSELILKPRSLDYKVMFPGPTGTNTVEAALKLARKATGRQHILSFTNAFHGMTLGSLSVTGNAMKRRGAGIPLTHTSRLPYDGYLASGQSDFEWLENVLEDSGSGVDKPAAIIVETVQGEGGLRAASAEWLRTLESLCRRHEILLIVDDVQAGCGRTGSFFSFEEAGITPDIVCLSKSISGSGLPLALTLFRPELDLWEPGEHNGTFRGNNPAFVTGTAALKAYWADPTFQNFMGGTIAHLQRRLDEIIGMVDGASQRGRGLLAGVKFADPNLAQAVAAASFAKGLLVETSGSEDEVLKIMPPLTISTQDLDAGCDILAAAVREVTSSVTGDQAGEHSLVDA